MKLVIDIRMVVIVQKFVRTNSLVDLLIYFLPKKNTVFYQFVSYRYLIELTNLIISLRFLSVKHFVKFSQQNYIMKIFAQRLRELRQDNHLSMKQLAKELNTTDAAISNWENEINEPKISYLVSIANYFSVSTDYLLGLED